MRLRALHLSAPLLLAACAMPPYPAYSIEDDAEQVAQVVVADITLQDILRAGLPMTEWLPPDNFMRVIVPVRNIDDEPVQILAQVAFLDSQRRPLPDETNRQVMILPAGGTSNFEAISRGPNAKEFVLRLMWNK